MIDVVSAVTGGGAQQYKQPTAARVPAPAPSPPPPVVQSSLPGAMRIRVDNQLDMAIIEYRSTETGEVMHQYPTEAQVKALARAAELENGAPVQAETETAETADVPVTTPAPAVVADSGEGDQSAVYTPPAAATAVAAPAVTAAPPAQTAGSASPSTGQSITV